MTTRFSEHLLDGTHAARPAATAVPDGTLYACTDHPLVYQSDGATWATWASLTGTGYTPGGTDVAVADGGTGASTAAGARTNLDLEYGVDMPAQATFDDHSARHETGGADAIKLDDLAAPDDNTDLNVSITKHGLTPKGSNVATEYLSGTGVYSTPSGSGIPATIVDVKGDLIAATAADTVARLAAGTNGYALTAASGETTGLIWAEVLPWQVAVMPEQEPDTTINTWGLVIHTGANYANGGTGVTNGLGTPAVNDEIAWDVVLAAGTWNITLHHRKSTNLGIYTVSVAGTDVGTIDGYAASAAAAKDTISAISVATTGKKRLKFKMATKNASSSDYVATIQAVSLRRTA